MLNKTGMVARLAHDIWTFEIGLFLTQLDIFAYASSYVVILHYLY